MDENESNIDLEGFRVTFQVRAKHAALLEAARKVGGVRALAELCRVPVHRMYGWISMKEVPNFSDPKSAKSRWLDREWVSHFEKTLFSLTHQTLDELWPSEIRSPEFAAIDKTGEYTGGYDMRALAHYQSQMLALPSPQESAEKEELKSLIAKRLQTLHWREREVLKLRYGLDGGLIYTLDEVGRIFKINRERVRQLEANAIRKLQHPKRTIGLKEYAGVVE